MSFRDDREAAHQRADALEQELKRAQDELARLKHPSQARPNAGRKAAVFVGALTAATLVGGGAFWTMKRSGESEREARAAVLRAQAAEEARRAAAEVARATARIEGDRAVADERRRAEEAAAAEAEATAAATAARITWRGVVGAATGVALAADAPCTVEGRFTPARGGAQSRGLTVTCGGQVLYAGSSSAGMSLREGAVFGGAAHEYMLRYADEASETRVTLSTLRHTATVWREGDGAMRVTIYLRDVSDPREGDRLVARPTARQPSFAGVVERTARVTAVRGRAPVAAGARCAFAVRPVWEFPENCRMALRCGTTWLYGAGESGYLTCEVPAGRPVGALDENTTQQGGDPRVTWRGRRVTVSDFTEAGEWAVDLAL
jgi:hypothetical protein